MAWERGNPAGRGPTLMVDLTAPPARRRVARGVRCGASPGPAGHQVGSSFCRVGPGNFTPTPSQIPDLILSHHPAHAIARRLPPSAEPSGSSRCNRVGPSSTAMTRPLRSTGITPLQHYYRAVRLSPAHRYFRPRGWSRLCLVWGFACQGVSARRRTSFISFFVRSESRSFVPTRASPMSSRAGAVKVGRRTNLVVCSALSQAIP